MRFALSVLLAAGAVVSLAAQSDPRIQIDPATGRAVGAKETTPEDLKAKLDRGSRVVIIDVRDEASFEKETIPGAIHMPLEDLKARLAAYPKDTLLVFT